MPGPPCLSKKGESNVRFVPFKIFYLGGYLAYCRSGPPVDGPKDSRPCVLSLPERFIGDPTLLARDNIHIGSRTFKHRPSMFHTAAVKPTRLGPSILYDTPLNPPPKHRFVI